MWCICQDPIQSTEARWGVLCTGYTLGKNIRRVLASKLVMSFRLSSCIVTRTFNAVPTRLAKRAPVNNRTMLKAWSSQLSLYLAKAYSNIFNGKPWAIFLLECRGRAVSSKSSASGVWVTVGSQLAQGHTQPRPSTRWTLSPRTANYLRERFSWDALRTNFRDIS